MKSDKLSSDNFDEKSLRDIIKSSLPDAPQNPWFTRTVLNRLSNRSQRIASIIEYALYVAGFVTVAIAEYRISTGAVGTMQISLGQIITLLALAAIGGVLLYSLILPLAAIRK